MPSTDCNVYDAVTAHTGGFLIQMRKSRQRRRGEVTWLKAFRQVVTEPRFQTQTDSRIRDLSPNLHRQILVQAQGPLNQLLSRCL